MSWIFKTLLITLTFIKTLLASNHGLTITQSSIPVRTRKVISRIAFNEKINYIINGNFESPQVESFDTVVAAPWTDARNNDLIEIGKGNLYNSKWNSGQVLDLDTSNINSRVRQSINLTEGKYKIAFDYANQQKALSPASNSFSVYWNDKLVQTFKSNDLNIHHQELFVDSVNGTNILEFRGEGIQDNVGVTIDNIGLYGRLYQGKINTIIKRRKIVKKRPIKRATRIIRQEIEEEEEPEDLVYVQRPVRRRRVKPRYVTVAVPQVQSYDEVQQLQTMQQKQQVPQIITAPKIESIKVQAAAPKEVQKIVQQRVEVPFIKYVDKYVEVPVEKVVLKIIQEKVEVPVTRIVEKIEYVETIKYVDKIVEKIVEVPVENIVEKIITIPVQNIIQKIIENVTYVNVPRTIKKIIEVPIEKIVQQIVERIVQVPIEKQKIVQVPVPIEPEYTNVKVPIQIDVPINVHVPMSFEIQVPVPLQHSITLPYDRLRYRTTNILINNTDSINEAVIVTNRTQSLNNTKLSTQEANNTITVTIDLNNLTANNTINTKVQNNQTLANNTTAVQTNQTTVNNTNNTTAVQTNQTVINITSVPDINNTSNLTSTQISSTQTQTSSNATTPTETPTNATIQINIITSTETPVSTINTTETTQTATTLSEAPSDSTQTINVTQSTNGNLSTSEVTTSSQTNPDEGQTYKIIKTIKKTITRRRKTATTQNS